MIEFDFSNVHADAVGAAHGLADAEIAAEAARSGGACARLQEARKAGKLPFLDLPYQDALVERIRKETAEWRGRYRNFLILGIGGSALGPIALHTALCHRFHNLLHSPRLFVCDNVDPDETSAILDAIDPRETLVNVVTKSGETAETLASFLLVLSRLKDRVGAGWRDHLVFTTDPEKGFLRRFAREEKVRTHEIPPGVGGRFSIYTPVGLLPAAMVGIDIGRLLAGAAAADRACRNARAPENPAWLAAAVSYLLDQKRGKRIVVMMPYAHALVDVADWFRQLWAESLGKAKDLDGRDVAVGTTPIRALGATDQHSQVQLYNEGPNDKHVVFLEATAFEREVPIPPLGRADGSTDFLAGRSLGELLRAEREGTAVALTAAGRPNSLIRLDRVTPESVGALLYLFEVQTALAGDLYHVNPYDQPGVEAGKKAAFALMGRPGYEAEAARIRSASHGGRAGWRMSF